MPSDATDDDEVRERGAFLSKRFPTQSNTALCGQPKRTSPNPVWIMDGTNIHRRSKALGA